MDSEIVGFIFPNDPLLETAEPIELQPGLNVVYGLNGAGKSRLLKGVGNALRGVDSDVTVAVVVRVHRELLTESSGVPDPDTEVEVFGRSPAQAIAAGLVPTSYLSTGIQEFARPIDQRVQSSADVRELLDDLIWRRLGGESHLATEIADDGLFMMVPSGTSDNPSWNVWPVADLRRPHASKVVAVIDALAERLDSAAEVPWLERVGALEDVVTASPLFPSLYNGLWSIGAESRAISPAPYQAYEIGQHGADQVEPVRVVGRVDFGIELLDDTSDVTELTRMHIGMLDALAWSVAAEGADAVTTELFRSHGSRLLSPSTRKKLTDDSAADPDWVDAIVRLYSSGADPSEADIEFDPSVVESLMSEIRLDLESRVNDQLQSVLLDAPIATLDVAPAVSRFLQEPLVWRFGPRRLRLAVLSRAERLWAERAIREAVHSQARDLAFGRGYKRPPLVIVDEPESALHRAAEAHMARTLRGRAADGSIVLAATHSPELLDAPEGRIVEVKRGAAAFGRSLVHVLDAPDRKALADLGLLPSDLLRWPRVILLVEGEHDEAILEELLNERLRRARVKIIPLHGGVRLSHTIDSQVLFDHTDAHIVAVLDNLRADRLTEVWNAAVALAVAGDVFAAKETVVRGLPDDRTRKGDEASYMKGWLTAALDAGLHARATPYGLGAVDVIRYLPVDALVPGATSWAELDAQHQEELDTAPPDKRPPRDFKKWLELRLKVKIETPRLRQVARGLAVPRDIERLMKTIEAIGGEVR
ncbi:ATP-dependent nuclease [Microbacterium sp. MC2]